MILLGLGSNLASDFGDRFKNIELAISYLELHNIKILKESSYYETPSYPDKEQPKFINVVISISSNLKIEASTIGFPKKTEASFTRYLVGKLSAPFTMTS